MTKRTPMHREMTKGLFAGALILLVPSCLGDQVGGEGEAGSFCVETERRPLELDDANPLGFAAADVLAFAAGEFETELGWSIPAGYGGFSLTPEAGDTTLTLSIASNGARATLVARELEEDPDAEGCADLIEIETQIHLSTTNGAFDDTLPVVLLAQNAASASAELLLESGTLQGSFELVEDAALMFPEAPAPDDWDSTRNVLYLRLAPERVTGVMMAEYTVVVGTGESAGVSPLSVPFGRIEGDEACYDEDFGGILDDGEAVSRLAARLAGSHRLDLVWSDDLPDRRLLATIDPSSFCLDDAAPVGLVFSADVELTDADSGEFVGTWPLKGSSFYEGDGTFQRISLVHEAYMLEAFAPEDLAATVGDFGVDLSGADAVALEVLLELGTDDAWSGELAFHAMQTVDERDPPCQSEPVASDAGAGNCSGGVESSQVAASAVISEVVR